MIAPAPSAACPVPDRTAYRLVDSLRAKDHDSPVRKPVHRRRRVRLGSLVLCRDNRLLREAAAGRDSGLGSLSQKMGVEGTGLVLDLAGLGGSPSVVRVHRRCRCFVVGGVCRLGCSEGVGDSCFVKGCRRCWTVLAVARIDCRRAVGLVVGMEDSAGRSSSCAVKEGRVGSAGCRLVWELGSWDKSSKEDRGRTGLVDRNGFEANCIAQQPE